MAQFIRDYCDGDARVEPAIRRLHDRYIHYKHRLASANIRLAAHVAKKSKEVNIGSPVQMLQVLSMHAGCCVLYCRMIMLLEII